MQIRNGKMYAGPYEKNPIPLEFGNREQIKELNWAIRHVEYLAECTLDLELNDDEPTVNVSTDFMCICGKTILIIYDFVPQAKTTDQKLYARFVKKLTHGSTCCNYCQQKYKISSPDFDEFDTYCTQAINVSIIPVYQQ